jgi:hypothetical protein
MEPVTFIVTAIVAGASSALKDTAGAAVRDAYAGLKAILQRKLGDDPDATAILEGVERNPDRWSGAVEDLVTKGNVTEDSELIAAARRVLESTDPAGMAAGTYNVNISGGKVGAVGPNATVYMGEDGP